MADKTNPNKKPQQKPAASQSTREQGAGLEGQLQQDVERLASSLDAPDSQGQAGRLGDARFSAIQRQVLAGQIGRRQGNRHLSSLLAGVSPDSTPTNQPGVPGGSIQRQRLPGITGQTLATMHLTTENRTRTEGPVSVEAELVPDGQQPGRFQGYQRRIQAHSRAAAEANLCAVVEDSQGKFHALRTNWPGRSPDVEAQFTLSANSFRQIYWVNRPGRRGALPATGAESWTERARQASDWLANLRNGDLPPDFESNCRHRPPHGGPGAAVNDLRTCLVTEYVELLAVALDIDRHEIYPVPQGGDANPAAMVNFDIDMRDHGQGGTLQLPHDRQTPAPRPTITLGPSAIDSESHLSAVSTAIHEAEHVRQADEGASILERWRRSGSRQDFLSWLNRQPARGRNAITPEQRAIAIEQWNGDRRSREVLSYVEAFIRTYARREITTSESRFEPLGHGPVFYGRSGSEPIKALAIRRLGDFYATLDQAHQQDFARYAHRQDASTTGPAHRFWQAVLARVLR